jgi:hypothetical protein
MLQWLYTHVARVYFKCFICFSDVCYKRLSGYCICFTHILQMFYLGVAYACNVFQVFLDVLQVFQTYVVSDLDICCKCFSGF